MDISKVFIVFHFALSFRTISRLLIDFELKLEYERFIEKKLDVWNNFRIFFYVYE